MGIQEEQLSLARKKAEGASLSLEDLNSMPYGAKVRNPSEKCCKSYEFIDEFLDNGRL